MSVARGQKKKKGEEEEEADTTVWMVTFGDLLSLLLTFFVLMFSMNTLDDQVVKDMFSTFSGGSGVLSFHESFPVESPRYQKINMTKIMTVKDFLDFLEEASKKEERTIKVKAAGLANALFINEVKLKRRGPSFVVSFPARKMFEPGSAKINEEFYPAFRQLGETLRYSDSYIVIEGHTDDIPISTPSYPSNWELSAARASNVMAFFAANTPIEVERLFSVGYADTRNVVRNIGEGYRIRNRRIDIVIKQAPETPVDLKFAPLDQYINFTLTN